jgi:GMP synthase (glutamine-hydrolysing)
MSISEAHIPPLYTPPASARFLLLQMRNARDHMRAHEVNCFLRGLNAAPERMTSFDLLNDSLTVHRLKSYDVVLLGGAGEYSATSNESWMMRALDSLREVHHTCRPTFASCWGFQAMARATGGKVLNDTANAEVGTLPLTMTEAGKVDPVFCGLPATFLAPMGHEDHVVELPPNSVHLARSQRVPLQAFCFADRPIYCTQFHPELQPDDLVARVKAYPEYLERIAGVTLEEFTASIVDTPECGTLLQRFARMALP